MLRLSECNLRQAMLWVHNMGEKEDFEVHFLKFPQFFPLIVDSIAGIFSLILMGYFTTAMVKNTFEYATSILG